MTRPLPCLAVAGLLFAFLSPSVQAGEPTPVGDELRALIEREWIALDEAYSKGETANTPITTTEDAAGAVDGVKNGKWGFHVASNETNPWWEVDLGEVVVLDRVVIFNRTDGGCAQRTKNIRVLTADRADCPEYTLQYQHDGTVFYGVKEDKPLVVSFKGKSVRARYVRLAIEGNCSLALDEVEVYAAADPEKNVAFGQPADQISTSQHSTRALRAEGDDNGTRFSLEHTREVVGQAIALAERMQELGAEQERHSDIVIELYGMRCELEDSSGTPPLTLAERKELYLKACRLKREIAFTNPKLQAIDRLLFIKRHHPTGPYHMCDQFYGCNQVPGGGLFVLSSPFGTKPTLTNLLEGTNVENGRLEDQPLTGSFLSPEISFDGREILFAHSECQATATYQWFPEASYHLFKCNADGTGLVQLTDGDTDDFDPCYLPNGRVAFITTRRGGYLRCGRHCPTYATFTMNQAGGDILPISYHETHEWQPSVDHNGMLVYTRWDYVDRDTNVAHHLWTSYPDGRDPRSYHGNYPVTREGRPWMEMDVRAVPGSSKYVATTGAHHGNALGALILIDQSKVDDGAMSQLETITPDCLFPETKGKGSVRANSQYGTAWPLSEDDYLCMYAADSKNHGIYWIDRYGNRELLYRDESIPCFSPMPLQARETPPLLPSQTLQAQEDLAAHDGPIPPSTVAVMNIYDSDFQWPEGTRIEQLRIIQALAKLTPPPNEPRIGIGNQTSARRVLGTVPVEEDGSVYFECPPGKAIYFQAIDQHGQAVMSMRSDTYVHAGEQLTCVGCHEPKHRRVQPTNTAPLAMQREPSKISPDVDGSSPLNYVRLVQPVLDRHCVDCHEEEKAIGLSGKLDGPYGWSRSYVSLAQKYGFYYDSTNGSINSGIHGGVRTTPGQFGWTAAPLRKYLDKSHHGVNLPPEDLHRIRLWLDCNSDFYGAYERIEEQARGEIVEPSLE